MFPLGATSNPLCSAPFFLVPTFPLEPDHAGGVVMLALGDSGPPSRFRPFLSGIAGCGQVDITGDLLLLLLLLLHWASAEFFFHL